MRTAARLGAKTGGPEAGREEEGDVVHKGLLVSVWTSLLHIRPRISCLKSKRTEPEQQRRTLSPELIPSDTKVLLTNNSESSEIVTLQISGFHSKFLEKPFFPGDFEDAKSHKNYEN